MTKENKQTNKILKSMREYEHKEEQRHYYRYTQQQQQQQQSRKPIVTVSLTLLNVWNIDVSLIYFTVAIKSVRLYKYFEAIFFWFGWLLLLLVRLQFCSFNKFISAQKKIQRRHLLCVMLLMFMLTQTQHTPHTAHTEKERPIYRSAFFRLCTDYLIRGIVFIFLYLFLFYLKAAQQQIHKQKFVHKKFRFLIKKILNAYTRHTKN